MPVSCGLRRLLRIRRLEAEQLRQALAESLAELRAAEEARVGLLENMQRERRSVTNLLGTGNRPGYSVAFMDLRNMEARADALEMWIALLKQRAERSRSLFLSKQTEQRQVETLIQSVAKTEIAAATRQLQQAVDELHLWRVVWRNRKLASGRIAETQVCASATSAR